MAISYRVRQRRLINEWFPDIYDGFCDLTRSPL